MATVTVTQLSRWIVSDPTPCALCGETILKSDLCYIVGTGLDTDGNSFITDKDIAYPVLLCASNNCFDHLPLDGKMTI